MEIVNFLANGFAIALQPMNIGLVFAGCFLGTVIGILPGLGGVATISLLIPIVFAVGLPPESALMLFAGVYYGSEYGGAITSILLNIPGESSSLVTGIDGHPLARQGRGGTALAMAAISSFVGGTISVFALMVLAPVLAGWALHFGPAEYFALTVLALTTVAALGGEDFLKGMIAAIVGLIAGTVGLDPAGSMPRFTFGELKLYDGVDFIIVVMALFAISEVLTNIETVKEHTHGLIAKTRKAEIKIREVFSAFGTMVRSSGIGFLVGILPGAGATIAAFLAYTAERSIAKDPSTFGKGDLRGVSAPEAANNAAAGGTFVPLLTLGIPGSASTAVILVALLGMQITPGPLLIERNPEIFWSLIASMYIGNMMLLAMNMPLIGIFIKILTLPLWFLMPAVIAVSFVAIYSLSNSLFDLRLLACLAILGYFMRKLGFPAAPAVLGLVLGGLMETNLRRALSVSDGEVSVLFTSPIAAVVWIAIVTTFAVPLVKGMIRRLASERTAYGDAAKPPSGSEKS